MKKYGFGIDVGGTTTKLGLFETDGTLLEKWEIKTDTSDQGKYVLPNIAAAVKAKMEEKGLTADDIQGLGIGVPGPVRSDGVVNHAVNLGWGILPVQKQMEELCGFPVRVGNDANVAALGEAWMGAGRDFSSIVCVTLGTGIGGGVIIDHRIIYGAHGAGGEIGHFVVNPDEEVACNCGMHGCLEQYASATGFARMTRRRLAATEQKSVLREKNPNDITAKDLFDAAKAGDELAMDVVNQVCTMLADALAKICVVADPEAILIGGGVSKAGEILVDAIEKPFHQKAFHACIDTKIRLATLGNDAGIYGAMRLILV